MCWGTVNNFKVSEVFLEDSFDFVVLYNPTYHKETPLCLTLRSAPCRGYNSLHEFLLWCIDLKIKNIVLFGADGGGGYCDGEDRPNNHSEDTEALNRDFPDDTGETRIFNCSEGSAYTKFPIIQYADIPEILKESH